MITAFVPPPRWREKSTSRGVSWTLSLSATSLIESVVAIVRVQMSDLTVSALAREKQLPVASGKSSAIGFVARAAVAFAVMLAGMGLGSSCGPESFDRRLQNSGGGGTGGGGAGDVGGNSGADGQDAAADAPNDVPQDMSIDTGPPPACPGTIQDKITPCNGEPPCAKTCGLNLANIGIARATKLCTCAGVGQTWQCPNLGACTYPPITLTCFNLPTPLPACPVAQVEAGSNLIAPNATSCTLVAGQSCGNVCGSTTANSYQDSGGNGKIGYCVCVTKGTTAVWQCASINEWPPEVTPADRG